jgi:hypothetical protein
MIKINFFAFIVAFGIGLFFCYVLAPQPDVIVKFPNPYNSGKIVYKDKSDTCYKYRADKVECPVNKQLIKSQPVYEDYIESN